LVAALAMDGQELAGRRIRMDVAGKIQYNICLFFFFCFFFFLEPPRAPSSSSFGDRDHRDRGDRERGGGRNEREDDGKVINKNTTKHI
jgi:hypothetical protein